MVATSVCAAILALAACGASSPPTEMPARRLTGESALDDEEAAPTFDIAGLTLPEPPASVDVDEPSLEPITRVANEILARELPVPEDAMPAAEVSAFIDGRLATYLNAQAQAIRALWSAMQDLPTRVLGVHVVARALAGATLLSLASRIDAMPLPAAVRAEPARASGIRDALAAVTRPMRDRGVQALGACASAAVGSADPTIDEWRLFCDGEIERAGSAASSSDGRD